MGIGVRSAAGVSNNVRDVNCLCVSLGSLSSSVVCVCGGGGGLVPPPHPDDVTGGSGGRGGNNVLIHDCQLMTK